MEAAGVDEATGAIIYYGEKQKKKRTFKRFRKERRNKEKTSNFSRAVRVCVQLFFSDYFLTLIAAYGILENRQIDLFGDILRR